MKTNKRHLRSLLATIGLLAVSLACTAPTEPEDEDDGAGTDPEISFRDGQWSEITLTRNVPVGTRVRPIQLVRIRRTSAGLLARAESLITVFLGQPRTGLGLRAWADRAVLDRYGSAAAVPFGDLPDLSISYQPYTDTLSLTRQDPPAIEGPVFSRAIAATRARAMMDLLSVAGLIQGTHVLGRSGSIVVSPAGVVPHRTEYLFHFFRVVDGFILRHSMVEVAVSSDYQINRISLSDVNIGTQYAFRRTEKSSSDTIALLEQSILAEVQAINPAIEPRYLSEPFPSYNLDPMKDDVVALPEMAQRWTTVGPSGAMAKSKVSVLGFMNNSSYHRIAPPPLPIFCREFELLNRVVYNGTAYVVDLEYAISFLTDPRDPLGQCDRGRLHQDPGTSSYQMIGAAPGGFWSALGVQDLDRDFQLCDDDSSSPSFGQCVALGGTQSFETAFATFFTARRFRLLFQRPGVGPQVRGILVLDCPGGGLNADCHGL